MAFQKPTLEEVAQYCLERKNGIDPEEWWAYYESKGWVIGPRSPMKNWKAAIITWEKKMRSGVYSRTGKPEVKPRFIANAEQTKAAGIVGQGEFVFGPVEPIPEDVMAELKKRAGK